MSNHQAQREAARSLAELIRTAVRYQDDAYGGGAGYVNGALIRSHCRVLGLSEEEERQVRNDNALAMPWLASHALAKAGL